MSFEFAMKERACAEGRRRRERGDIEGPDAIAGVVLLVIVPILCVVVASLLGQSTRSDKFDFREKPQVDPPPDQEELDLRLRAAQDAYVNNAKSLLSMAESLHTRADGDYFRQWATRALLQADSDLKDLAQMIQRYPQSKAAFQRYLARIQELRTDLKGDLARAEKLDVLRRGLGRQ